MTDDPNRRAFPDTANAQNRTPVLSLDTVFEVLANQRRRFALYSLIDSPGEAVALECLIEDVATLEAAHANTALTHDRYVTIATDIYHWHVVVLAEVGIVEYDTHNRTVRYQSRPLVETWVERIRRDELS